jgi:pantothenate synthetase
MNDLIKFQAEQILALQNRNNYLENELKQAKTILQEIINDWEVFNAEEVKPNVLDKMFDNPMEQLDNLLK